MSTTARTLFTLALALTTTATAAAEARPAAWEANRMTAAATYFPKGTSAMVIGVGAEARTAASALLASLQSSSELELAIDARSLGKVDDLGDPELVKRAFGRPIQRVAIVRVFPSGGSSKAVVTVYGTQGQVTAAFTLAPGKALVENDSPDAAELGVGRDELANVQGATSKITGAAASDDEISYERHQIIGVSNYGVVSFEHVNFSKSGRTIKDIPGLYDAMGMSDRANTYREEEASYGRGMKRGATMMGVGTLGLIGFGTWALVRGASSDYDAATDTYSSPDNTIPVVLTVGSLALTVVGILVMRAQDKPETVSIDQAITMVDEYNAKQRRTTVAKPRTVRDVSIAPSAMPSGGGFILSGSF